MAPNQSSRQPNRVLCEIPGEELRWGRWSLPANGGLTNTQRDGMAHIHVEKLYQLHAKRANGSFSHSLPLEQTRYPAPLSWGR